LCNLQEHLHSVYVGATQSRYVDEYGRRCTTRAQRFMRLMSGGWGPLLEYEDIVRVVILLASEIYQVQQHCSVNVYADIKKMSIQRSAVDKTLTGGEVKLMLFLSVHDIMCTGGY